MIFLHLRVSYTFIAPIETRQHIAWPRIRKKHRLRVSLLKQIVFEKIEKSNALRPFTITRRSFLFPIKRNERFLYYFRNNINVFVREILSDDDKKPPSREYAFPSTPLSQWRDFIRTYQRPYVLYCVIKFGVINRQSNCLRRELSEDEWRLFCPPVAHTITGRLKSVHPGDVRSTPSNVAKCRRCSRVRASVNRRCPRGLLGEYSVDRGGA